MKLSEGRAALVPRMPSDGSHRRSSSRSSPLLFVTCSLEEEGTVRKRERDEREDREAGRNEGNALAAKTCYIYLHILYIGSVW